MGIEREAPHELGRRIAELSPAKRALLEMRLKRKPEPPARELPLERADRDGPLPLSFGQQRLWLLEQLTPGTALYHIAKAMRVTGRLDTGALQAALDAIVARHEALRTHFRIIGDSPVQVVADARPVQLRLFDLRELDGSVREGQERELLAQEVQRPFNLNSDAMLRASLLRLADEESLLLLVAHHIASDGWSMGILSRELATCYEAFAAGRTPALPELPVQYADYAVWQRQWLQGEVLAGQVAYWRQKLAGVPEMLDLPTDRPRPAAPSFKGGSETAILPSPLADALRALARAERATLFMLLLAAWKTLLFRYSGQTDLVVGSPIAGRRQVESEGLIGFFVNTLALRTDLSGDPTFRELLARVRDTALDAYGHQDVPFEKLVEELQPERSLSRNPLFQVMFALQNAAMPPIELAGVSLAPVALERAAAKFDLTLEIFERAGGLHCWLEYSSDLFDAETIARLLGCFHTLLEGIAANPEGRISTLPILSEAERRRLLAEWNDTATAYPRDRCIQEVFEEQAARSPQAVAVTFEGQAMSFGELNARANQLAHLLRKHGIGPDSLVGIRMERSPDLIVAMLGVLKAGGAYLPLDTADPRERLAFLLDDARPPVVIAHARLFDGLVEAIPAGTSGSPAPHLLCMDRDRERIARESTANPPVATTPESLAYVIYTSGSTGRPKGVCIPHRGVLRLVLNTNYVELTAADVVAQASNTSFDAATFEVWGALLNGARLAVLPRETVLSPGALARAIREQEITVMFLTTALFNQIATEDASVFHPLRVLIIGGEAADARVAGAVLRAGPPRHLINGYGPTEATTFSTTHEITGVPEASGVIPIGQPIANSQAYVLDRHLQPVPVGVPGELYLGGDGLARGYLNRPDLTSERFVFTACMDQAPTRLYKTGDLARYLPDGNIEFLGRADDQVKLRGFRIELGEIEAVLGGHPGVSAAVVLLREDTPGDKRLVAYVVGRDEGRGMGDGSEAPSDSWPAPRRPSPGEIRSYLNERLPEYMLPSAFVVLDALPLTPNGKADRRALPRPEPAASEETVAFAAPRTDTEEMLAAAWREILAREPIGIHDDFFALGGHSLLATRVISRTRVLFGVEIPLRRLFEAPTVAAFAEVIDRARAGGEASRGPAIVPVARRRRPAGGEGGA